MKRIVVDSDIPCIEGVFEPFFDEVLYIKGVSIQPNDLSSAEALVIRTRTRVDRALLENSAVRLVTTATIGTDHIDLAYCDSRAIEVFSASGCNARAVAQWVMAALREINAGGVLGIVGVGNVGREVEQMAVARGWSILRNDPIRESRGERGFVDLDLLLQNADVVTLHVPLTELTQNMVGDSFLSRMKRDAVLLNSSRGEVVDEESLVAWGGRYALDVWRGEPDINLTLMQRAVIATPHIAGYSWRGKARATEMCVQAVGRFFGIAELAEWQAAVTFQIEEPENYDILYDDRALRASPGDFESLRRIRD